MASLLVVHQRCVKELEYEYYLSEKENYNFTLCQSMMQLLKQRSMSHLR